MTRAWIRAALAGWLAAAPVSTPLALAGPEDPAEAKPETVTATQRNSQLRRSTGQTAFISARQNYAARAMLASARGSELESAVASGAPAGTDKRDVVESDVFAVDPETGTLFLLNSQRGLQAVSRDNELLGRAAATGNNPDSMYPVFANGKKRLVVLEQDWMRRFDDQAGNNPGAAKIQLVTYDVTDPAHPKMVQTLPLDGTLADSKLVGDVLYIAASTPEERNYWSNETPKDKGRVYSVKVTGDALELVHTHEIGLPQVGAEMMQIVETPAAQKGKFHYHLLALSPGEPMTERAWTWDRGSAVEVVDITDPHGKATSVLKVNARGRAESRTQVSLVDGHLIVGSNYIAKDGDWRTQIRRVAIESWKLPAGKDDKVLSAQEANFRKVYIERQVAIAKAQTSDPDELDAVRTEELDKAQTGLRGFFVKSTEEGAPLTKLVPDSAADTGDTTGQSASLRDVRFSGNRVMAFWVPGNMIDPLDLFTLVNGKVTYLNRTEFDGWIETSRIFEYKGRTFILGLGFTVPASNNTNQRRYPQAKLFELVQDGERLTAKAVATHVIKDGNMWPALTGADKFIDARVNVETGEGSAMFTVATYKSNRYTQGGKLLGFDLNAAVTGKGEVFTEGALLAGNSSWLKRVFVDNVTLRRLAFSDKQLNDYGTVSKGVGSAKEIRDAVAKLELARNLRGYVAMGGERLQGVQIVSDDGYWWMDQDTQETELRLVADSHADAELSGVQQTLKLDGSYMAHVTVDRGADGPELLVLVKRTDEVGGKPDVNVDPFQAAQYQKQWKTTYRVMSVVNVNGELKTRSAGEWEKDGVDYGYFGFYGYSGRQPFGALTALADGSVVIGGSDQLRRLVPAKTKSLGLPDWSLGNFAIEGAPKHVDVAQSIVRLSGTAKDAELLLEWQVPVQVRGEKEEGPLAYYRTYIAPIRSKDGVFSVGKAVNIPGSVVTRLAGGVLLTEEQLFMDRGEDPEVVQPAEPVALEGGAPARRIAPRRRPRNLAIFEPMLQTVRLTAAEATLLDVKPADGRSLSNYKQLGNLGPLVTFVREQQSGGFYPMMGFRGFGMPFRPYAATPTLEFLNVDSNGLLRFEKRVANGVTLTDYPQLVEVFATDKKGAFLGVVMESNKLQVVRIDAKTGATEVVSILPVDERGGRGEPVTQSFIPHGYWWGWNGRPVSYNPVQGNIVVTAGLAGACQFELEKEAKKVAAK